MRYSPLLLLHLLIIIIIIISTSLVNRVLRSLRPSLSVCSLSQRNDAKALPLATRVQPSSRWVFSTLVAMACIGGILVAAMTIACLRHHAHRLAAKKLGLGPEGGSFTHQEYQVRLVFYLRK